MLIAARESFAAASRMVRVQYIESTGTQWIDTDFLPKAGDVIRGRFYSTENQDSGFFGTCGTSFASAWGVFRTASNWVGFMRTGYGTQGVAQVGGSMETDVVQTISNYTMFGTTRKYVVSNKTVHSANVDATLPLSIFAIRNPNSTADGYSVMSNALRCMSLRVERGGVAVAEFLPVRIGTVAYMHNTISGNLLANAGTGSFITGPDVTT